MIAGRSRPVTKIAQEGPASCAAPPGEGTPPPPHRDITMRMLTALMNTLAAPAYRLNRTSESLPDEAYRALSIGAISAKRAFFFWNSLETGLDKEHGRERLASEYAVGSRREAIEVLDLLMAEGHRRRYEVILPLLTRRVDHLVVDDFSERFRQELLNGLENLTEAFPELIRMHVIDAPADLASVKVDAWDMGRVVLIARAAFDVGYLYRDEAWEYILASYRHACECYPHWSDFARGYLVGIALAHGDSPILEESAQAVKSLLANNESPWKMFSLVENAAAGAGVRLATAS